MRRLVFFTIGAMFGMTALSQDLLECVDPDVLRSLVFHGTAEQVISTAVPPKIADIAVPGQFSWIGSAELDLGSPGMSAISIVRGAYRTDLAPDTALDLAMSALEAGGWEIRSEAARMRASVFNMPGLLAGSPACRADNGITVSTDSRDGKTYVLYAVSPRSNSAACSNEMRISAASQSGLDLYLPSLDLPLDPVTGAPARMGGGGGGTNSAGYIYRIEFRIDDSIGNVSDHFARQMANQGWLADASWSGSTTAGSSWSLQPESGIRLKGTLQVTAVDDMQFMATLNITTL